MNPQNAFNAPNDYLIEIEARSIVEFDRGPMSRTESILTADVMAMLEPKLSRRCDAAHRELLNNRCSFENYT